MPYLNQEDILKADDVQTRDVDVPEWGGTVRVRGLSGADRNLYEASQVTMGPDNQLVPDMSNRTAKLVARAIVGEDGEPLFSEFDVGTLGQKSGAALARVFEVAEELSGINNKAVETAAANLGAAPNGASTSS